MSIQPIIKSLEELIYIHESLIDISVQKTEVVKDGTVEKLQSLLIKERKLVQALEQAEAKRQSEVEEWSLQNNIPLENATITGILEAISDEQAKADLETTAINLTTIVTKLKQQEQLNQTLIQQSMQFVEISLDMMQPSIRNMNYGGKETVSNSSKRSVFDSKA